MVNAVWQPPQRDRFGGIRRALAAPERSRKGVAHPDVTPNLENPATAFEPDDFVICP
jgi:hypothetical protein